MNPHFEALRRQQFRRYFQPSRILLCIVPAPTASSVNIITLSFSMHCSYQPPMLAIAVNDRSSTYELIRATKEYVLAVPGPKLAEASMYCGVKSLREGDKVRALSLDLVDSETVSVPGLRGAIANVEMQKFSEAKVGDHLVVIGEARRFGVNKQAGELPLLSVGPYTDGYQVLCKKGIHRLGIVREGPTA